MPPDFSKSRVNPSGLLQSAMSANPVIASNSAAANTTAQLKAQGGMALGQGIARGASQAAQTISAAVIERARQDRMDKLNAGAEAANKLAAATTEAPAAQHHAEFLRAQGVAEGDVAQAINPEAAVDPFMAHVSGGVFAGKMTPEQRKIAAGVINTRYVESTRARPEDPETEQQAGTKVMHPSIGPSRKVLAGRVKSQILRDLENMVRRHPAFSGQLLNLADKSADVRAARRDGREVLANVLENTDDPKTRDLASAFGRYYEQGAVQVWRYGPNGRPLDRPFMGTVADYNLAFPGMTPQGVVANAEAGRFRAPRAAVANKGGKQVYTGVVENVSQYKGQAASVLHALGGKNADPHVFASQMASLNAGSQVAEQVLGGSWAKSDKDKIILRSLKKGVEGGTISKEALGRYFSRSLFGLRVSEGSFQENSFLTAGGEHNLMRSLDSWRKQAKGLDSFLSSPELHDVFAESLDSEFVDGVPSDQAGPLSFVTSSLKMDPGVAAEMFGRFGDAAKKSPIYRYAHEAASRLGNLTPRESSQAVGRAMPVLKTYYDRMMSSYVHPNGKRLQDMAPREQAAVLKDGADLIVSSTIDMMNLSKGDPARGLAPASGSPPTKAQAEKFIQSKNLDEGPRDKVFDIDDKHRLQVRDGKIIGVQKKKGPNSYEDVEFSGEKPESATDVAAFDAAQHIYQDEISDGGMDSSTLFPKFMSGGSGVPVVDDMLRQDLGAGSAYQILQQTFQEGSKSPAETSQSIKRFISTYAQQNGLTHGEIEEKLQKAALSSDDPVVKSVAHFFQFGRHPVQFTKREMQFLDRPSIGPDLERQLRVAEAADKMPETPPGESWLKGDFQGVLEKDQRFSERKSQEPGAHVDPDTGEVFVTPFPDPNHRWKMEQRFDEFLRHPIRASKRTLETLGAAAGNVGASVYSVFANMVTPEKTRPRKKVESELREEGLKLSDLYESGNPRRR